MNALNCSVLAMRLRCDSAAPFESPVVPPVYYKKRRSSPQRSTGVRWRKAHSSRLRVIALLSLASIGGVGRRRADAFARSGADDLLDRGLADDFGERRRGAVEDDNGLDPRVVELMLELARRVERIDVDLNG